MKILSFETLVRVVQEKKARGLSIIHCHGCFDLLHIGHIKYFQAARKMGDLLIVTVSPDQFVDKGPGRPAFSENLRVEAIAALECVCFVALNRWPTAEETLRQLRPDVYVKGQEFQNLEDKTGKIQREFEVIKEIGARLQFTQEIVFSSTKLLETHFKNS